VVEKPLEVAGFLDRVQRHIEARWRVQLPQCAPLQVPSAPTVVTASMLPPVAGMLPVPAAADVQGADPAAGAGVKQEEQHPPAAEEAPVQEAAPELAGMTDGAVPVEAEEGGAPAAAEGADADPAAFAHMLH
jgi:hypothetical protein